MNLRIIRKILKNKSHIKHKALKARLNRELELYARNECWRSGIDEAKWGSVALRIPERFRLLAS